MFKIKSWALKILLSVAVFSAPAVARALVPSGSVVPAELGTSTAAATFVQVASGNGYLFDIVGSSVTASGDYAVCFDSASVTGLTMTLGATSSVARFMTDVNTVSTTTVHMTSTIPYGLGFANGLACAQKSTGQRTNIYYRQ